MDLSVVVPTLNGRDVLGASLDALAAHAPDAEVVVVNGPSVDGTSGMVRDHDAADVLLEVSERNLNASRNAGIAAATGDVVALVGQDSRIRDDWVGAVADALAAGADAVGMISEVPVDTPREVTPERAADLLDEVNLKLDRVRRGETTVTRERDVEGYEEYWRQRAREHGLLDESPR